MAWSNHQFCHVKSVDPSHFRRCVQQFRLTYYFALYGDLNNYQVKCVLRIVHISSRSKIKILTVISVETEYAILKKAYRYARFCVVFICIMCCSLSLLLIINSNRQTLLNTEMCHVIPNVLKIVRTEMFVLACEIWAKCNNMGMEKK